MKGLNYNSLLSNWDLIIDKLCEECTPHDVLGVVLKNLQNTASMCEKLKIKNDNLNMAISNIEEAMKLINPES
jgi:hypothetical protein